MDTETTENNNQNSSENQIEKPKIADLLEAIYLESLGLDPETAEKAAINARKGRESRIKQKEPDKEAYLRELEYLSKI